MSSKDQVSRRGFMQATAAAAAVAGAFPHFVVGAPNDRPLKIGLVGCGGRGTGAAINALEADKNVKITALADLYPDRLNHTRAEVAKRNSEVSDSNCFLGFDAYQKVIDTDVDYVILATPPHYRPLQFAACIDGGKHVFMEKPVAVDPVGVRKIMKAGSEARNRNLCVAAGTQRRHQSTYQQTIQLIKKGVIGDIRSAECHWDQGQLWYRPRSQKEENGWSNEEWMIRDWVNWAWLSGDHIVEQHVHNIDVINWVIGTHPEKVVAMGARERRVTGNQYDFFCAGFEYPGNVHVHSTCRQINGCANNVSEKVVGADGVSNCNGWISTIGVLRFQGNNPYVQEHADLMASIRGSAEYLNEAQNVAESTMCAVMARISAYTGREVTWKEMMESDLALDRPTYELTDENIRADVPVPGKA